MLNQLPVDRVPIDQLFHAVGDPTRRKIIEHLSQGPIAASDLAKPLGISLAAVVQHLQVLEQSGLIRTEKAGRIRTCHLDPSGFTVAMQWIAERRALWERRLDRLGAILAEEEPITDPQTINKG
jgi:DNA-binding transcriptional ArsR family regulator